MKSKAFYEFVSARCEEILEHDEELEIKNPEIIKINEKITKIENDFLNTLNKEQRKIFMELKKNKNKMALHRYSLAYIQGKKDAEFVSEIFKTIKKFYHNNDLFKKQLVKSLSESGNDNLSKVCEKIVTLL